jgi:hypothetical protein
MTPAEERRAAPVSDAEVAALIAEVVVIERQGNADEEVDREVGHEPWPHYAVAALKALPKLMRALEDMSAALAAARAATWRARHESESLKESLASERRRAERVRNMRCDRTPEEMFLEPPFTPRAQGYAAGINEGIRCAQAALEAQEPGS